MHYNVFYFLPQTPEPVKLLVIPEPDLYWFVQAYRKGDTAVYVRGELLDMRGIHRVHIFDCSKSSMTFTEVPFRFNMQLQILLDSKKHAEELKKYFLKQGVEVTARYITGEWGYEKHLAPVNPVNPSPVNPIIEKQLPVQPAPVTEKQATQVNTPVRKTDSGSVTKRIFISHSSKDSELVNAFCDLILDNALGIDTKTQLFNTSLDGSKPLSGEDFRDRIKDELQQADVVLQFITKNYKSSEVCMNEMGAAWVLNAQVIPLILEPGAYDVGFINSTIQQVKLWDADALFEFVDNHKGNFFPAEVTVSRLNKKIKAFVKVVGEVYQ